MTETKMESKHHRNRSSEILYKKLHSPRKTIDKHSKLKVENIEKEESKKRALSRQLRERIEKASIRGQEAIESSV